MAQKDVSRRSTQVNKSILGDSMRFVIVETTNFLTIFFYTKYPRSLLEHGHYMSTDLHNHICSVQHMCIALLSFCIYAMYKSYLYMQLHCSSLRSVYFLPSLLAYYVM